MIKRIKKVVISVMAAGMLFGGVMPVQANVAHRAALEWSRNGTSVRAYSLGRRTGTTPFIAMRMRISSNAITVVNGVARNNPINHPWTTQDNPRYGHQYRGARMDRTISQGYVASQVEIRPLNAAHFGMGQSVRQDFN